MPLRVSGVPPDLETTRTSVLLSLLRRLLSVRAMPSGSVLSRKWTRILSLFVPRQSATSWGPSAEPPIPTCRMSVNFFADCGVVLPVCIFFANCLMLLRVLVMSLAMSFVGAVEASRSQ